MHRLLKVGVAVTVLALAGCNNSKLYGRIIGFVVNGQTGQRINAFPNSGTLTNLGNDANSPNEVFALVEGRFKRAEPCGQGDINNSNLIAADGCYRIEGVPANVDIPVFAQFDGFDRFHGKTRIETNAVTTTDLVDADPQVIGNIMVWPKGFQVDYTVLVQAGNRPVADATVNCQLDPGFNDFQTDGNDFIPVEATTTETVRVTTGADGTGVLPGAQLVNGGEYNCEVFRADEFQGRAVQNDFGFTAGVSQPQIDVQLSISGPSNLLFALRSNADAPQALLGLGASLIINLNQPAEIVPATVDCETVSLTSSNTDGDAAAAPVAVTNTAGNNASEQVTASLSSDGLTLTIAYNTLQTPFDPDDLGSAVTFNGVWIRPKDATQKSYQTSVGSAGACPGAISSAGALFNARTNTSQVNRINLQ